MCALRTDPPPIAVETPTDRVVRPVAPQSAAARLIVSRTCLETADMLERSAPHLQRRDFAGYDLLRASGMTADEATAEWHRIVHDTLTELAAALRDRADHDFDRAVATIGTAVRSSRRKAGTPATTPRGRPKRCRTPSTRVR